MLFYLAARYSRYPEMQQVRCDLEKEGHVVTSRWINGKHDLVEGLSVQATQNERIRFALEDLEDLRRAETVITFTESARSTPSRGGRHVEYGVALERGQRVIVIGPRENIFHCLLIVEWFPDYLTFQANFSALSWGAK